MADGNLNNEQTHVDRTLSRVLTWVGESELIWFGIFLLLAVVITLGALTASTGYEDIAGIGRQVDGTAYRPYVYRQLVPLTIRIVSQFIPEEKMVSLDRMGAQTNIGATIQLLENDFALNIFSALINFMSLIGFAYVYRALLRAQLSGPSLYFNITVACALYGLTYTNHEGVYSYDYPLLFLYTTAIYLMSRQVWWAYYFVFILATINKETTILLTAVYALTFWRKHNSRHFTLHLLSQFITFAIITSSIRFYFSENPGSGVEIHFLRNIRLLMNPPDVYDFPLLMMMLFVLIVKDWYAKPSLFKNTFLMVVPLVCLGFAFGWVDELRDYYEVYPAVIALAGIPLALYVFGVPIRPRPSIDLA
ncbi:MAG: hypothetical protein IH589_16465 [Anaerolineales bacterium]|nr:hypothetical protein [Anaerolineales bacterium]